MSTDYNTPPEGSTDDPSETGTTPVEPTPQPTQPPPANAPTALYVKFDLGVWQVHDVQNKLEMAFNNTGMEYVAPPADA